MSSFKQTLDPILQSVCPTSPTKLQKSAHYWEWRLSEVKQAQHHSIRKHKWCCLTEEWDKQIEVFKKQLIEIKINNGERQGEKKAPRGMNRVMYYSNITILE